MELNHSFTVPASTTEAWDAFNQIESMGECFPGAVVTLVEGDTFEGTVKVKLGPISMMYSGSGTFLEKDQASGRLVVEAKGKDKRGNGTAGATVTAVITDSGYGQTKVDVQTDLQITGKPAQFGRGVIQDVSDKLLQQFVTCLQSKVGAPPTPEVTSEPEPAPHSVEQVSRASEQLNRESQQGSPSPMTRSVAEPQSGEPVPRGDNEALDLGATVIPILLKTYRKQVAATAVALLAALVLWKAVRRR